MEKSIVESNVIDNGSINSQKFSLKKFFSDKKEYFIVFGILFFAFNIILIANGFYPYGNETILVSDSYSQIGEYFEYLFSVLKGESSIFYSGYIAGGFEVLSSIEYMLLNPFYILVFLFGENLVFEGFNIAIFFMLLFNGFVFLWFAKKYFKKIKSVHLVLFALLYTFSGYILLSFCFISWFIYPGLILLLADAFIKLVKDGKILRFSLLMVWYVCACFSVGISTNVILVILFFLYIWFMIPKRKRGMAFTKLFIAYVIAICLSVAILLPSIYAMMTSYRFSGVSYFSNMSKINLISFDGIFIDAFATIIGLSYLIYLFKKDKKSREFKFYCLSFVVLVFPTIFVYTLALLCGGFFNSFINRFYFLLEAFLFICTLKNYNLRFESENSNLSNEKNSHSKLCKAFYICLLVFYVISYLILTIVNGQAIAVNIKSPQSSKQILKFLFLTFVLISFILFFAWFFSKRKLLSKKIYKFSMYFVMITCLIFNYAMFGLGTGISTKVANEANLLTSSISAEGKLKEFYVDYDYQNLFNSIDYGFVNLSLYSSLVSEETITSYELLGLYTANTSVFSNTGTLISDSLLGMNYFLSSYNQSDRPYLELVAQSENYYLYKNILSSTGAIIVDSDFNYDESLSVYENFENLSASYGIQGALFETVSIEMEEVEIEDIEEEGAEYVYRLTLTAQNNGILYTNAKLDMFGDEREETYSIENAYVYNYKLNSSVQDIGYFEAGETKTIYILSGDDIQNLDFVYLNYDVASQFLQKVQETDIDFSVTKNGYEVQGMVNQDGNLIVFAVDLSGMNYTLNGEVVYSSSSFGSFFVTSVESGEISIVASYRAPYLLAWILIIVFMILFIIILLIVYHFTKFRFLNKIMPWAFLIVTCLFLSVFYLFSLILTIFV